MLTKTTEYCLLFSKFKTSITLYKKQKSKKVLLIPYSTLEGLSNDPTHNSLR